MKNILAIFIYIPYAILLCGRYCESPYSRTQKGNPRQSPLNYPLNRQNYVNQQKYSQPNIPNNQSRNPQYNNATPKTNQYLRQRQHVNSKEKPLRYHSDQYSSQQRRYNDSGNYSNAKHQNQYRSKADNFNQHDQYYTRRNYSPKNSRYDSSQNKYYATRDRKNTDIVNYNKVSHDGYASDAYSVHEDSDYSHHSYDSGNQHSNNSTSPSEEYHEEYDNYNGYSSEDDGVNKEKRQAYRSEEKGGATSLKPSLGDDDEDLTLGKVISKSYKTMLGGILSVVTGKALFGIAKGTLKYAAIATIAVAAVALVVGSWYYLGNFVSNQYGRAFLMRESISDSGLEYNAYDAMGQMIPSQIKANLGFSDNVSLYNYQTPFGDCPIKEPCIVPAGDTSRSCSITQQFCDVLKYMESVEKAMLYNDVEGANAGLGPKSVIEEAQKTAGNLAFNRYFGKNYLYMKDSVVKNAHGLIKEIIPTILYSIPKWFLGNDY